MSDNFVVKEIPVDQIYIDDFFNSRGHISPTSIDDLAKDIDRNGLESPIIVQETKKYPGYTYLCLAGNRRLTAFRKLKRTTIPSFVKTGLTDLEARSINLRENLLREDLNPAQEAHSLQPFFHAGWLDQDIGAEFGRSNGWVQVRRMILTFPPDIQTVIAAGMLSQQQIRDIYGKPTKEMYEIVKSIKEARLRGEKVPKLEKPPTSPTEKKKRTPLEITDMIIEIGNRINYGLHTRTMAWCAGEITDIDLWYDIKDYAEQNGLEFSMPDYIVRTIDNAANDNPQG